MNNTFSDKGISPNVIAKGQQFIPHGVGRTSPTQEYDVSVERFDVARAQEALKNKFDKQRTIRQDRVRRYAADMAGERWKLSIIEFINGQLVNGYHRFLALIASGCPQDFIVYRTDDLSVFDHIDSGAPRSISDVFVNTPYSKYLASIAKGVAWYMGGYCYNRNMCDSRTTRGEIIEYIRDNRGTLHWAAHRAVYFYNQVNLMTPKVIGVFLELCAHGNAAVEAEEFITSVFSGDNLNVVRKLLRDRLIKNIASKSRLEACYILALLIKAFNADRSKVELKKLALNEGEEFPRLYCNRGNIVDASLILGD